MDHANFNNSLILLFLMPVIGINQGAQPIIGYFYAAKNYAKVKETYWLSVIISTLMCIVGFLAGQLAPRALLSIFNRDPEFLELILVLPGILGLEGVWLSTPISDFLAVLVTTFFVVRILKEFNIEQQKQNFE